ncbi:DUF2735 domain-containing protein [Ancylobacter defluvii]|uniref:DUF2735 domain-containing protein n=1 Tax=Ancylobacter defluvii TaxID=1282440 RepID=A0A9W6NAT4_9HYPH|nr:DUF2735 domain-containing protein [Ancylobacter defluvii]MBS7589237.1 DUF2735 domain-containing protein [Ancylobacter defluvii]GLK84849.1 hypothetical protein GCM10017653_29190 [Ancylobacter defluvii]
MNVSSIGGSAKIYEFPRGGRAGLAGRRESERFDVNAAALRAMPVIFDAGWYHEEAIKQDQPTGKRS